MNKNLPVYELHDFEHHAETNDFYANRISKHVATHTFTNLPHKHDFYLVMLVTKGNGWHEIDFEKYKVEEGTVFVMQPGQMHYWKLSKDIDGLVFFHSRAIFEENFAVSSLHDFSFFKSFQSIPLIKLKPAGLKKTSALMNEILIEFKSERLYKKQKLASLINLVYIELSRNYKPAKTKGNITYFTKARQFEDFIEEHFKENKSASYYAGLLNITEKHLNRITQASYGKTSTELIAERVLLEAKRMLIHSGLNVTQIAYALGFNDKSYFVRFFKKNSGNTPLEFLESYNKNK